MKRKLPSTFPGLPPVDEPKRARGRDTIRARLDAATTSSEDAPHWRRLANLSPNGDIPEADRRAAFCKVRQEAQNNPHLRGQLKTLVNTIVGKGPRLKMGFELADGTPDVKRNRKFERKWSTWFRKAKIGRKLRTMLRTFFVDGEGIGVAITNKRLPTAVLLDLRLAESEQLVTPVEYTNDENVVDGIRFDEAGNPITYFFYKHHPADIRQLSAMVPKPIDAAFVAHLFDVERPGQVRGYTPYAGAVKQFADTRRFGQAVIGAAETAANMPATLESDAVDGSDDDEEVVSGKAWEEVEMPRRGLLVVPPGTKANPFKAEQPTTTYEGFKDTNIADAGRAGGLPRNLALGNSKDANFSSAKLDHLIYWLLVAIIQDDVGLEVVDWLLGLFIDELVELEPELLDGVGPLEEYPHDWLWPGREPENIADEADAFTKLYEKGAITLADWYARQGKDWREQIAQWGIEQAELAKLRPAASATATGTNVVEKATSTPTDPARQNQDGATKAAGIAAAGNRPDVVRFAAVSCKLTAAAAAGAGKPRRISLNAYNGGKLYVEGHPLPVVVDVGGLKIADTVSLWMNHENTDEAALGATTKVTAAGGRIDAVGFGYAETERQRNFWTLHDSGVKWKVSIGVEQLIGREVIPAGRSLRANGRLHDGPFIYFRGGTLTELSIVRKGGDQTTSIAAKHSKEGTAVDFEQFCQQLGIDTKTATADVLKAARARFADFEELEEIRAAGGGTSTDVDEESSDEPTQRTGRMPSRRSAVAVELRRQDEIIKAAGDNRALAAQAIEENWPVSAVKVQAKRDARPSGATFQTRGGSVVLAADRITAAACRTLGFGDDQLVKWFGERTMNDADPLGHLSLVDTIRAAARLDGIDLPLMSMGEADFLRAAFSSVSLPKILGEVANKSLEAGRTVDVETVYREIVHISSVSNFQKHTRLRLAANMKWVKVGPNGELKDNSQLAEQTFETQVDTFGMIFWLSRKMIRNDDMGAFTEVPNAIGRGYEEAINLEVWKAFLDSSLFSVENGNLLHGTAYALEDYTDLDAAEALFDEMTDVLGQKVRFDATRFLTSKKLKFRARNLFDTQWLNNGSATQTPQENPAYKRFPVLLSSYLSDTSVSANASATQWHLLPNQSAAQPIDLAFLDGRQVPTIEPVQAPPGHLAMGWQAYGDFGVAEKDKEGAVRVTGVAAP